MNLIERYNAAVACGDINDDALQRTILQQLQHLSLALEKPSSSWLPWRKKTIQGVYVYGPVGAGKTYLIDLFYECVLEPKKNRFHFHHFMQQIDAQLRRAQGQKDPLRAIASGIAAHTRLLCFDEFLVDDVAYAMILAQLLDALHQEGVVLVISSNTKPDDLYAKGVHRERFLPAIALINRACVVMHLNEQRDYRLGRTPLFDAYLSPLNQHTIEHMTEQFVRLEPRALVDQMILIQGRMIPYIQRGERAVWFAFDVLCQVPRSQLDYLELADCFDHVFLSDVPCLTAHHTLQAIMFIHFIDVMYDRGIHVIISAAVPIAQLYEQGELTSSFQRTQSRLNEMQSADYLTRHPRRAIQNLSES